MNNGSSYKFFKWQENPFTQKIIPSVFTGHSGEIQDIVSGLMHNNKFSVVTGTSGTGKTSFLKHLAETKQFQNGDGIKWKVLYLPKPPKEPKEWVDVFNKMLHSGFLGRFGGNGVVDLYNLGDKLNSRLKGGKCVLFIDEAHEASVESLEWLRTIADHTENLTVVMAGLPELDRMLNEKIDSLRTRVGRKVELKNLSKAEMRELIKRRVEHFGGQDTRPFTQDAMDSIYEQTDGSPREVLKVCDSLITKAAGKGISTIDSELFGEIEKPPSAAQREKEMESSLPDKQKAILSILVRKGALTPSEIVSGIKADRYKSKDNAVRSVNNILKRLMSTKLVERKKLGKCFKYVATRKAI